MRSMEKKKPKFYGVFRGRKPGVYRTWEETQEQINSFSGAKHRAFATEQEAYWFSERGSVEEVEVEEKRETQESRPIVVYIDGSAARGKAGSGVFFGNHDSRNRSVPFHLLPLTNQRAESAAALEALKVLEDTSPPLITLVTDSMYLVNSMTLWLSKWEQNGWTLCGDCTKPVKNRDLLEPLAALIRRFPKVQFRHVFGHRNNAGNEAADRLAKLASGLIIPVSSVSSASNGCML